MYVHVYMYFCKYVYEYVNGFLFVYIASHSSYKTFNYIKFSQSKLTCVYVGTNIIICQRMFICLT